MRTPVPAMNCWDVRNPKWSGWVVAEGNETREIRAADHRRGTVTFSTIDRRSSSRYPSMYLSRNSSSVVASRTPASRLEVAAILPRRLL
jgi:hypothetical protein